jgi:putative acetyltransferase
MITLQRTNASHPDFQALIVDLDKELWERYPLIQQNFAPFNKIDYQARVVVVYEDNIVTGCGCFRPMKKEAQTVEVKRMYVVPHARSKGIGKLILKELQKWAVEEGNHTAKLETGLNQPEAIAAYEKSGYTRIPNFEPYENISESICMMKVLV